MLQSPYFSSWPLRIRFFAADVYQLWTVWCDRADGFIPDHIGIVLDGNCPHNGAPRDPEHARVGTSNNITVDYSKIQDYLEKSVFLLDDPHDLYCKVCEKSMDPKAEMVVVCPQAHCHCISHLLCLSARFLQSSDDPDRFIPVSGSCPACQTVVQWPVMMQELSFRTRGGKELQALLRRKARHDKRKAVASKDTGTDEVEPAGNKTVGALEPSNGLGLEASDTLDDELAHHDVLDDGWADELDMESDHDNNEGSRPASDPERVEIVIEDSDMDDIEIW